MASSNPFLSTLTTMLNRGSNRLSTAMDSEKSTYEQLLQQEDVSSTIDESFVPTAPTKKRSPLKHWSILFSKSVLVLLAILGLTSILGRTFLHVRHLKPVTCSCGGTTTEEAIKRGCVFSPLAIAWLPPQCLDEEIADEFDRAAPGGAWPYWADLNATIPLSRHSVGLLADTNGVFYTTQEWHVVHCMFTWRKHYRSRWTGKTVERRSNGLDHIAHCEKVVRIRGGLDDITTVAGIALNADEPGT